MHVARAKRGKTRASKARLVLVLLLIGRGSGARFFNQSQSVAMQNQSNCGITFDTQLKSALFYYLNCPQSSAFLIFYTKITSRRGGVRGGYVSAVDLRSKGRWSEA